MLRLLKSLGFLLASGVLYKLYNVEIKVDLLNVNSHHIPGLIVGLKSVEITKLI